MSDTDELRNNLILGGLPDEEFEPLRKRVEIVEPEVRRNVYEPGSPITELFFPITAVFSLVALADERVVVEVATIGREGMVGLPFFLGAPSSPHPAFCQVSGLAARLRAEDLRELLVGDGAIHQALNRLAQSTMVQIAQNVVCNSTHPTEQRAARWLLTTQDRVGRDEFPLTQEFLAQMLGVRRPTVSDTARRLQARELIEYRRGRMTIRDRAGLERASCGCYGIVRAEFDALANPA